MAAETQIWSGTPSQIVNLGTYVLCGLLCLTLVLIPVAIVIAVWKYLTVRAQKFELTSERLKAHRGVLSRQTEEIELYRVVDTRFDQPFFLRLFGLGNVVLFTTDSTTRVAIINAVQNAEALREQVRQLVEKRREQKGVRVAEVE